MLPHWLDALVLALAAVAMAALTWRGWADPLVDFGREVYVPWRLSEDARLYEDVAWFNGPLSQQWNALLFRVFGPGMGVLYASNAFVLCATVGALHTLVRRTAGRSAALLGGLVFLLVFAFGQYFGIANYNWIAPYSHELTHGVALALGAIVLLTSWRERPGTWRPAAAGALLGLCFLTKVETFLAGAAGSVVLLGSALTAERATGLRGGAAWLTGFVAPVLASLLLFGLVSTLGAWPSVLAGEVAELPFYRAGLGLDEPALRLAETLTWASMWAVSLAVPVAAAWLARETRSTLALPISGLVTFALLAVAGDRVPWTESLRPLQLVVLVTLAALAFCAFRSRHRPDEGVSLEPALALGVFGLVLLSKMLLNVRSGHYGFALAAPATVVTVAALWSWLPAALDRRGWRGDVLRGAALATVVLFCAAHVRTTAEWMERKTERVGSGRDAYRADLRGAFVELAVDHLRGAGYASVVVLPEGVMINYLARTPNPTPYLNFMPPEEILFGDTAWAAAFRASPPDAIVIVPKDTSEYGRGSFGTGYGTTLFSWIRERYEPVAALRIDGIGYTVQVLERRAGAR